LERHGIRQWGGTSRKRPAALRATETKKTPAGAVVLDTYVLRWKRWCEAGLKSNFDGDAVTALTMVSRIGPSE